MASYGELEAAFHAAHRRGEQLHVKHRNPAASQGVVQRFKDGQVVVQWGPENGLELTFSDPENLDMMTN